eukprot:scaffold87057_cov24-Tisochrysis_lutea.AAC.1
MLTTPALSGDYCCLAGFLRFGDTAPRIRQEPLFGLSVGLSSCRALQQSNPLVEPGRLRRFGRGELGPALT